MKNGELLYYQRISFYLWHYGLDLWTFRVISKFPDVFCLFLWYKNSFNVCLEMPELLQAVAFLLLLVCFVLKASLVAFCFSHCRSGNWQSFVFQCLDGLGLQTFPSLRLGKESSKSYSHLWKNHFLAKPQVNR